MSPSLLSSLCRVIAYIRMRMQWKVSRNWFSSIRVVRVSKSKHALSSTPPLVLSHPWIGFSFACLALLIPRSLILARLQLSPSLSALNKDRLELSDNSESPATPSLPAPAATSSQVCLHPPCSPLTLAFIAWWSPRISHSSPSSDQWKCSFKVDLPLHPSFALHLPLFFLLFSAYCFPDWCLIFDLWLVS